MKDKILDYLNEIDIYHPSDDFLVDILVDEFRIYEHCMKEIEEESLVVDITRDPDKEAFLVVNKFIGIRQQCVKNIQNLCRQLGMSPQERQKLRISLEESKDEFEEIFNKK